MFILVLFFQRSALKPGKNNSIFLSTIMSIGKVYVSSPLQTLPVMQTLLAELDIFPSVFFTKYILKKHVTYNYNLIHRSICNIYRITQVRIYFFHYNIGTLFLIICWYT